MKELTLKKVRAASCFGLITDEMTDVSVVKFMVKSLVDFFFLFNTILLAKMHETAYLTF